MFSFTVIIIIRLNWCSIDWFFCNIRFVFASFQVNFKGVFHKIFIVINSIYGFEFAVNLAILLHFAYNFSHRGFVKGGGRFFFQESLYTEYGHSFFTYICNMIDGFQDLLFYFSNLIIIFWKVRNFNDDCV